MPGTVVPGVQARARRAGSRRRAPGWPRGGPGIPAAGPAPRGLVRPGGADLRGRSPRGTPGDVCPPAACPQRCSSGILPGRSDKHWRCQTDGHGPGLAAWLLRKSRPSVPKRGTRAVPPLPPSCNSQFWTWMLNLSFTV